VKCVGCGGEAEYIFVFMGSGGSYCEKCYKEILSKLESKAGEYLILTRLLAERLSQCGRGEKP
jgi:hypothetical protein